MSAGPGTCGAGGSFLGCGSEEWGVMPLKVMGEVWKLREDEAGLIEGIGAGEWVVE